MTSRDQSLARRGGAALAILLAMAALFVMSPDHLAAAAGAAPARPGLDGAIRDQDLWHDSRDERYRTPTGPVTAGTAVTLRLRAAAGDLSAAEVRLTDRLTGDARVLPMAPVATDPNGGELGHEYWQAVVGQGPQPAILDYTFVAIDGPATRYVADDRRLDGGAGQVARVAMPEQAWQITAYDPAFETPAWAPGSVVYQVFPDRFANADPANDPSPDATPGPSGAERYRHGDVHGEPIITKAWEELPEGHCRAYQPVPCDEQALNRDFFGGDLAGLTAALDGLADLGVTVLYLNPIFAAPSNHRYDTSDYRTVDPDLGTLADFDRLIANANERGIRVVLDGVFNHVSADSPWFDRFGRYEELGACESADSRYRDWFTFRPPGPGQPEPCAPTGEDGDDTYYVGWANFDSIPELLELPEVLDGFVGADGVVPLWIERGTAGWRLDVADSMSHEFQASIRDAAKAASADAIVIAEQWHDSTPWLLGDQADSTMNYRFRRAVIGLVNGATPDPDGSLEALTPSAFASAMLGVREDYPPPAWQALMNLVDSHDTARILWTLTPGADNDQAKSDPSALAEGKAKLRLVSAIQLTFPGMASVYYGDEVGLTGFDDPDDRRPYPWGAEDLELRDHYRTLARLRAEHEALRDGDLAFLHADDAAGTLAYLRRSEAAAAVVALNLGDRSREIAIDVRDLVPDGIVLTDALDAHDPVVVADGIAAVTLEPRSVAVLLSPAEADLRPPDPPADLVAEAGASRVELTWAAVDGAERYRVLRSLLSGGGYETLAETADTAHVDSSVRDGVLYHYVVLALDAAGNVAPRSDEVRAVPQLALTEAQLRGLLDHDGRAVSTLEVVLSAVDGTVTGEVVVEADTPGDRVAAGVLVEVGLGPVGSDPLTDPAWAWSAAGPVSTGQTGAVFQGTLQPETLGEFAVNARVSTDGGRSWQPVPGSALIVARPGADDEPPPAPGPLELLDVSGEGVRFRWPPVDAPDLHRYVVLRGDGPDAPPRPIGTTDVEVFLDTSVAAGQGYRYTVVAEDTSFNASAPTAPLDIAAGERMVSVELRVSVPANTGAEDTIFVAGDFQGWDPGSTPMTRQDDGTWTITLDFEDGTAIEYKYTRGSWEAVEKDAGCGEIPNRTLTVEHGGEGRQSVADTVEKWRDLDACG